MIIDPSRIVALADEHDTPYYLYDLDAIVRRFASVRAAFGRCSRIGELNLLYAVKANPSFAILAALFEVAEGLDVSSGGEIEIALRAGWPASRLSFTGPGKRRKEIAQAIELGVGLIAIESVPEIDLVAGSVRALAAQPAKILVRMNPPDRIHAFAVSATGGASPFGVDDEALDDAARAIIQNQASLSFEGLHVHAGSQCRSAAAYAHLADRVLERAERLAREHGLISRTLDFGGGFGVTVRPEEHALDLDDLARRLEARVERFANAFGAAPRLSFELGRYVAADAGLYVARVVSVKRSYGTRYVVLDGGFNHLLSASLAFGDPARPRAPIRNVTHPDAPPAQVTLVGPLCSPLDVFARDLVLPEPSTGDLIVFEQAGAYGYSLSPLLFLGHDTPVELALAGGEVTIARRRSSIAALFSDR